MAIRKNRKYHARPRYQRAFLKWFAESRKRFKLAFRITKRTREYLELESNIEKMTARAMLTPCGLQLILLWQGCYEIHVHTNDAKPVRTSDGYICSESPDPEEWGGDIYVQTERKIYPTKEDIWRVHVHEIFLEYVNNSLTKYPPERKLY